MDIFSNFVFDLLSSIPVYMQIISIAFFSYAEGVPVIGSILPGGTIALLAGSLSASGIFSPLLAFLVISIFSFLGDMTGFYMGSRFKEHKFIKKIIEHEKHQKSWDLFDRHIAIISIFGKLIPVVRSTPSIFAGARGIARKRYIVYSFLGSFLWGFVGVYAGKFLTDILGELAIPIIFAVLIISVIAVILNQFVFKKNK
jgi:membrane protein DedA with SNARE-associated domain